MLFSIQDAAFPINGFSTRMGGGSRDVYAGLNLGLATGDDPGLVRGNFACLRKEENLPAPIVTITQVHGTDIVIARREGEEVVVEKGAETQRGSAFNDFHLFGFEGDALYTEERGLPVGVYTADCLPLILSDIEKSFVMVIHGGWRGTVDGIVERSLEFLLERKKKHITVILGPSIGPCCFEMGVEHLHRFFAESVIERDGSSYIDLKREVRQRLTPYLPSLEVVENIDQCTCCNPDLFYSYRRDGVTGRHLNFALL